MTEFDLIPGTGVRTMKTDGWQIDCTTADCGWSVADSAKAVVTAARDAHINDTHHRQFRYLHGGLKCAPF